LDTVAMRNRHRRPTPFIQQLTNLTCQISSQAPVIPAGT
jgi:hypothetical protein